MKINLAVRKKDCYFWKIDNKKTLMFLPNIIVLHLT
jgi:hypothetical protein